MASPALFLALLLLAASAAASQSSHHRPAACFAVPPAPRSARSRRRTAGGGLCGNIVGPAGGGEWSYVPPYGNVPRLTVLRSSYDEPAGGGGGRGRRRRRPDNDRFAKKVEESRHRVPVVQNFGSADEWQRSKVGTGVKGDDKAGDDGTNERYPARYGGTRRGGSTRDAGGGLVFGGDGGNYWVNGPGGRLDGYPGVGPGGSRRDYADGGPPRRRSRRGGRRGRRDDADGDGDRWDTRRPRDGYDYEDDDEYDLPPPPPTRSRSSFRGGAPPPPRPVKQFYDRLFWFGFDPDVTGPRDRTMFGGTRGKFNAMDMLNDREERQRFRDEGGRDGYGRAPRRRRRREMEDYYDDEDEFEDSMLDPMPPPELDEDELDFVTPRGQRNRRSRRGRNRQRRERPVDPRAAEYERSLGLAPGDEYLDPDDVPPPRSRRRRAGYAYRLDPSEREDLLLLDDGEYIDIEAVPMAPARADVEREMAREMEMDRSGRSVRRSRRRRSVEDRLLEGERVPPPGAETWGPAGAVPGTDPLESAALDALSEIARWKDVLGRRERDVEEARERLVRFKADAARIEDGLEEVGPTGEMERELGEALAGAEEASLALRLARAERGGARNRIDEMEERNWAVLSEYEARGAGFDG